MRPEKRKGRDGMRNTEKGNREKVGAGKKARENAREKKNSANIDCREKGADEKMKKRKMKGRQEVRHG